MTKNFFHATCCWIKYFLQRPAALFSVSVIWVLHVQWSTSLLNALITSIHALLFLVLTYIPCSLNLNSNLNSNLCIRNWIKFYLPLWTQFCDKICVHWYLQSSGDYHGLCSPLFSKIPMMGKYFDWIKNFIKGAHSLKWVNFLDFR